VSQTKAQLIDTSVSGISFGAGSASAPSVSYSADATTGLYFPSVGKVALATAGVGRLFADNSGNVGINTSTPGSTLDVKGTLRLSGSSSGYAGFKPAAAAGSTVWTLPTSDGTANQVLQTDGSANLSWSTPATYGNVYLANNNAFTGANTFTNTSGQTILNAATQDGIVLKGRAGGTSSYTATLQPTTLTTSRVLTLPDQTSTLATQGDLASYLPLAGGAITGAVTFYRGGGVSNLIEISGNGNTLGSASAYYGQDSSNIAYFWNRSSAPALIGTNNTERVRCDATGYLTGTVNGLSSGIYPSQQYYRLNSAFAGGTGTSAQPIFNVGVTLIGSTVYEFEGAFVFIKSAGTTSHNFGLQFGYSGTFTNGIYTYYGYASSSGSVLVGFVQSVTSTNTIGGSLTAASASVTITIKGTISVSTGGTLTPQYVLSANPGGAYSTQIGSYFKIWPLGASGANTSIGSWA
jgi:hypothetical protein